MFYNGTVELQTKGHADMHDITPGVAQVLDQARIERGLVNVFAASATSALTTIEFESGALEDLRRALDEIAPTDREYKHNLRWQDGNGHSHLRAALIGPSLSIPVIDSRLVLGTWQQIVYIDFDVRPRQRSLTVTVIGE
jgi:secondary thiamine-phosphate synthase enzyme